MAFNVLKFAREVRTEANRVTWPSGKETVQLTGLVLAMVVIMALLLLLSLIHISEPTRPY